MSNSGFTHKPSPLLYSGGEGETGIKFTVYLRVFTVFQTASMMGRRRY